MYLKRKVNKKFDIEVVDALLLNNKYALRALYSPIHLLVCEFLTASVIIITLNQRYTID